MKRKINVLKFVSLVLTVGVLVTSLGTASAVNAKTNWKKLYADYIEKDEWCQQAADSARLVYINNDSIPEIYIEGAFAAAGNQLLTIYKGKVYANDVSGQSSLSYVSKKGLVYENGGHMDAYYDNVGKLVKGKLTYTKGGTYGAKDNSNVQFDSNGEPIYEYYWEGQKVSKKTYNAKLKKAKGNYKYSSVYNYNKMLSMDELKKKL